MAVLEPKRRSIFFSHLLSLTTEGEIIKDAKWAIMETTPRVFISAAHASSCFRVSSSSDQKGNAEKIWRKFGSSLQSPFNQILSTSKKVGFSSYVMSDWLQGWRWNFFLKKLSVAAGNTQKSRKYKKAVLLIIYGEHRAFWQYYNVNQSS